MDNLCIIYLFLLPTSTSQKKYADSFKARMRLQIVKFCQCCHICNSKVLTPVERKPLLISFNHFLLYYQKAQKVAIIYRNRSEQILRSPESPLTKIARAKIHLTIRNVASKSNHSQMADVFWWKENSSYMKLLTARFVDIFV